ncbi:putative cytosolic oligopeptidase A [Armadillidium nasatum]|uniref:oligopeptidase A n=1 Tax=Armadillidium nasatum TaxID=96803 RepID=A0A5N5SM17_9CRUS|nr:putative cytosolic oligopeptidase A [Armadillidium nasatum]
MIRNTLSRQSYLHFMKPRYLRLNPSIASDNTYEKNFASVVGEVDKLDAGLTYVWSTVKTFYSVRNDILSTSSYLKMHERAKKARIYKYKSQPIYNACKEIYVSSDVNEIQKRVLRKFILEARLNGLELPKKDYDALAATVKKLEENKTSYRKKLKDSSMRFSYRIMDPEIIKEFPPSLLKRMAYNTEEPMKGPWTITHHPQIYEPFLKHCPDKDLRGNAWKAYTMRNSSYLVKELDNCLNVENIRSDRNIQANILGFKTFADMSMETKMAGSVDNVLALLAGLFDKAKRSQTEELSVLKEFAQSKGFEGELEEFDIPYWRRRHLEHLSEFDDIRIEEYFNFKNVWEQLLSLSSGLFGIQFEEVPTTVSSSSSDAKVKAWDTHVRFYNVFDSSGKKVSSFYLDAFRRPNQKIESKVNWAWMLALRSRCQARNYLPLASLIFNFQFTGEKDNEVLLTFEDVQTLFKKFGHALQHLLSTVPYCQVAGLTNIEWDAVEVCSNFMLFEPSVLEKLAKHYKTGESLPPKYIKNIVRKQTHMAGYDLCNELFLAHFDIKLHTENGHCFEIMKELWPLYKPFQLNKEYSLPCWFSPIMSDIWAAAYYSHTWSKMIAADAFSAFKESDPQEITSTGRRFKDTFLSLGGGTHSAEVFRQFRGRDPTPEALHKILAIS